MLRQRPKDAASEAGRAVDRYLMLAVRKTRAYAACASPLLNQ